MASSEPDIRPRLIRLHEDDNVATATGVIEPGEEVELNGEPIIVRDHVAVGHKVAVVGIACGQKVIKFGCAIGSATRDIAAGRHVHMHNLRSDYIPTFTREPGGKQM